MPAKPLLCHFNLQKMSNEKYICTGKKWPVLVGEDKAKKPVKKADTYHEVFINLESTFFCKVRSSVWGD